MTSFLERITPEDRIYYTRIIFAFISAALVLGLNLWGPLGLIGFVIGLVLIIMSYFFAVYLLGVDPQEIGGHVKGLLKGLGTGVLLFLVIWLMGFNFIYAATAPPP
ncbi:MAG: hypothetical protein ACFFBX_01285 [Promethearchaeota archaeon]